MSKLTCLNCAKIKKNYGRCSCGVLGTITARKKRKMQQVDRAEYEKKFEAAFFTASGKFKNEEI